MINSDRVIINKHNKFNQEEIDAFYRKFEINIINGCWEWKTNTSTGYGKTAYRNKQLGAHQLSWLLYNGDIPKGKFICHSCDNRKCVNPDHLFLGTPIENVHDMIRKGRHSPLPYLPNKGRFSKLTSDDVLQIRQLYDKKDLSIEILANRFGVSSTTIINIGKRKRWKWL